MNFSSTGGLQLSTDDNTVCVQNSIFWENSNYQIDIASLDAFAGRTIILNIDYTDIEGGLDGMV